MKIRGRLGGNTLHANASLALAGSKTGFPGNLNGVGSMVVRAGEKPVKRVDQCF